MTHGEYTGCIYMYNNNKLNNNSNCRLMYVCLSGTPVRVYDYHAEGRMFRPDITYKNYTLCVVGSH